MGISLEKYSGAEKTRPRQERVIGIALNGAAYSKHLPRDIRESTKKIVCAKVAWAWHFRPQTHSKL
jgi:hypothetical protein